MKTLPKTLLLLAAYAGCGGQVGEETIKCDAVERTPLGENEESPLGFSAADVLGSFEGVTMTPVRWADDTESVATIVVTYSGGPVAFEDREWIDDGDGAPEPALGCQDAMTIEVSIDVSSEDGRLGESFTTEVAAESSSTPQAYLEPETFAGTLDPRDFAPDTQWTSLRSLLNIGWSGGEVSGELYGQALSESTDEGNEGTASAEHFDMAEFGPLQQ